MAGMGCDRVGLRGGIGLHVIHLDKTILPLKGLIHIWLYVVQTPFIFFELDHPGSQPFIVYVFCINISVRRCTGRHWPMAMHG